MIASAKVRNGRGDVKKATKNESMVTDALKALGTFNQVSYKRRTNATERPI